MKAFIGRLIHRPHDAKHNSRGHCTFRECCFGPPHILFGLWIQSAQNARQSPSPDKAPTSPMTRGTRAHTAPHVVLHLRNRMRNSQGSHWATGHRTSSSTVLSRDKPHSPPPRPTQTPPRCSPQASGTGRMPTRSSSKPRAVFAWHQGNATGWPKKRRVLFRTLPFGTEDGT